MMSFYSSLLGGGTREGHSLRTWLAALWLALLPLLAVSQPTFLDAASLYNSNVGSGSNCRSTAVDAAGNQYVTGNFGGTLQLGSTTLTSTNSDGFVAKRSASTGDWLWAVRVGGNSNIITSLGAGITIDASGAVLVTGSFGSTATFGSGAGAPTLTAVGGSDAYVAKFNAADGTCVWAVRMGGSNGESGIGVSSDANGDVLVTGIFTGTTTFGSNMGAPSLSSVGGSRDVFVAKFSASTGACLWAVQAGGASGGDSSGGVAVDASGNALVTGFFTGTASFGSISLSGSTSQRGFVAKFNAADGTCSWALPVGGGTTAAGTGIAVDASGNALVTGYFNGTATVGTGTTTLTAIGSVDIFVAKFAGASGSCIWAARAGGSTVNQAFAIAADGYGNAVVGGYFSGTGTFGAGAAPPSLSSVGGQDVFVARFRAVSGRCAWALRAGGAGNDQTNGVAVDGTGRIVLAGFYRGAADFGSTTLTGSGTTAFGFLARLTAVCDGPDVLTQDLTLPLPANGTATLTAAQVDNGSIADCGLASGGGLSVSPSSFTCANLGANTVTLTVTDANGQTSTATATVTVTAPILTTTTWTGAASTDWADCRNWSSGTLPASSVSAVLPAGQPRYPVVPAGSWPVNDLTLASGASLTLTSAATLQVYGNWYNYGATLALPGNVTFTGPAATQVLGGSSPSTFSALTVNKATGQVQLGQDAQVDASLTLTSGLLRTGSRLLTLGSTATIAESETAYVLGTVETTRNVSTPGSSYDFGGLGLTLAPAAALSTVPGSTLLRRTTGTVLTGVNGNPSIRRYYDIQPATDQGLNVTATFGYFEQELNGISVSRLALFKASNAAGPWGLQPTATLDALAKTMTLAGINSFSVWTLASFDAPLPVELTQFTATAEGQSARLRWATASEQHSAHFEIERSTDGKQFTPIGKVAAQGTTSSPTAYSYLDDKLTNSTYQFIYYRLKLVDQDASFSYSPVRIVTPGTTVSFTLHPNPTRAAVAVAGLAANATVTVFDALGRTIAQSVE